MEALAFSLDGTLIASVVADNPLTTEPDGFLALWRPFPTNQEPEIARGHQAPVRAAMYYPGPLAQSQPAQEITLVTAGEDGALRFWALTPGLVERQVITEPGNQILTAAVSPDGRWLATAGRDGQVRLYELPFSGKAPLVLGSHADAVLAVAFSPDSKHLASGAADRTVRYSVARRAGARQRCSPMTRVAS